MAKTFAILLCIICMASRGMCQKSQSATENEESSEQIASNLFPYPSLLNFQDLPVESDGSGLDDENFHKFIGKFYVMPEGESDIFENPFENEHRVEDTRHRSEVSFVPDDPGSNDVTEEPGSSDSSGEEAGNRRTQQEADSVSVAADGTKIIQRTPTTPTPAPPTVATTTKPPGAVPYGIKYPKPNTTEVKYMLDGTRITQFNTGIKQNNGTKEPSWKFLPDEFVPGYSDSDEQPNAAGYKYRDREGEEQKGKLIKQQIQEAVKENNPSYQIHKEKEIADSLGKVSDSGNSSDSRSVQTGHYNRVAGSAFSVPAHVNDKQYNAKLAQDSFSESNQAPKTVKQSSKYSSNVAVANSVFYNVKPLVSHSHARHLKRTHHKFDAGSKSKGKWLRQESTQIKRDEKHKGAMKKSTKYHLLGSKKEHGKLDRSRGKKLKINQFKKMPAAAENTAQKASEATANSESNLQKALRSLAFKNEPGVVKKKQNFAYISQCGLYTEPQNVSMVQHAWVTKTYAPYFYLYEKPKNYEQCKPSPWLNGTDMRGNVFISFEVKSIHGSNMENNAKICQKYCCKEPRCSAWVMRKQDTVTANCPKDSFCCWLKSAVPKREPNENAVSGIVQRERYRHPPTGMRSAVPLGGLGTGSFELRADGTFHEWTVENQSPGGAAKLSKTALDLMMFLVKIKKGNVHKTAALRTHAPHGFEGVEKMSYYGTYPVSKIDVEMPELKEMKMSLYAYSSFKARDPRASAVPAVTFSLDIENPTKEDAEVSFMLNLPLGFNDDTIRRGGNYAEVAFTRLVTAADCMKACAKQAKCMSWTTNGPSSCLLKDSMPLNSYEFGIISGVKGRWSSTNTTITCTRPGIFTQSGQISLKVVGNAEDKISFETTNEPEILWKQFKKNGTIGNGRVNETALHGSAAIKAHIPAGTSRLVTIIMSWHLPNRDVADERVGNYYSNFFKSVDDVSDYMERHLTDNILSIINWQSSIVPPKSIFPHIKNPKPNKTCETNVSGINVLPECLQDILMNSLSFWRSGMWMENGRWRQWEAFDCINMDPVHVDFHRFLPYVIFFPELAKNVMLSWADHQLVNGMIEESLSRGCLEDTGREGKAGGRPMADVNVAFVVQTYLIYTWTNDTEFFDKLYPAAMRALSWLIKDSTLGTDLPYRKPDTYDLFELDKYDHCAYNSILMKLALRAGEEMALLKRDAEKIEEIGKAYDRAHVRFEVEMWDDKDGFYHAWFDAEWGSPSWLMADTLYGQVWAYTLGLGDLVDKEKLRSHLLKERERNDTPYGLKVISRTESKDISQEDTSIILGEEPGCKSLENITKYESVWMTGSTDWSTLELHLGMSPRIAMHQAEKSLDHYRSTLRDQWNFHGLTSSEHYGLDGLPWASSHYTFHLVLWHLPLALSGQQYYAPNASLTFNPKFDVPYWLPFYTPAAMGNIEAKYTEGDNKEVIYKLTVTSGEIRLLHLSISDSKYGNGAIHLSEGQSASWSTPARNKSPNVQDLLSQMKR